MSAIDADIDAFNDRIVGRRVSESTAGMYERWIRRFEAWRPAGEPALTDLIDFDTLLADETITDYPWRNATGRPAPDSYAYDSRQQALSAIKLWLRLNYDHPIDEEVQHITSGEPEPFDPPLLSTDDVEEVIENADDDCQCDSCRAALRVSYDALLRGAEMCDIQRSDLDLDQGALYVRAVKGSNNITVSLSDTTVAALDYYLDQHDTGNVLFTNTYGNKWKPSSWSTHFRRSHHEVGIHSFSRHSPIVHRFERGESFGDIYRRARHSNPDMTTRYARLVGVEVPDWADRGGSSSSHEGDPDGG